MARGIPVEREWVPPTLQRMVIAPPDGDLTNPDIAPLDVITGDGTMTSVWQLDADELAALTDGGVVLLIVQGHVHPPVALHACRRGEIVERI